MEEMTCNKCKETKPLAGFQRRREGHYESYCRSCRNAAKREWARRNPEKVKAYSRYWNAANPEKKRQLKKLYRMRHPERAAAQVKAAVAKKLDSYYRPQRWRKWLKTKYGITEEQFDALVSKQRNKCAICKNGQSQGPRRARLCVDHDHHTNQVRGLLCFKCNVMLGAIADNVKTLRAAIRYVLYWRNTTIEEVVEANCIAAQRRDQLALVGQVTQCPNCHKDFTRRNSRQKCCSQMCGRLWRYRKV